MRKLGKLGVIAVSAVMMLGLFGCSSSSTSSDTSSTDQATEQESTSTGEAVTLQIYAANSLSKAMDEAQALYTQQNPNVTFADTQYEASGTLIEMLNAGQAADVLITASKGTMDTAVEDKLVDESTRQTMFNNDLVIITKENGELAGTDITLEDIASGKYTISVGDENVPAGNYACQSLSTVGAYIEPDGTTGADATGKGGTFSDALKDKVTLGAKVGDVCTYVSDGQVEIGMVYTSDVYRIGGVSICSVVPNDTHKAITYPGAVTSTSENAQAAQDFLTWCMTDEECAKIWEKWGFELAQS